MERATPRMTSPAEEASRQSSWPDALRPAGRDDAAVRGPARLHQPGPEATQNETSKEGM
jgi:hypothetical protein